MTFKEQEGITIILPLAKAKEYKLPYTYPC